MNLFHSTPTDAVVQLPSDRATTVPLRDIAPCNTEKGDFVYDVELFEKSDFVNQNNDTACHQIVMPDAAENDEGREA